MNNAMSLKAKIRNIAADREIPAQVILQNYMFERLLKRLSKSDYKDKFVLKGGMLVAAIVGLDNRATMDLDATLKGLALSPESVTKAINDICKIDVGDDVSFKLMSIMPIREDDIYGGYRVMLNAVYETITVPLSLDISTGDIITPNPVKYEFSEIFANNEHFDIWAYNIETVLAEKVETILRRSVFNTRPRDFYDVYILTTTQNFDLLLFRKALSLTAEHRGIAQQISDEKSILKDLSESVELMQMWDKYRKQFSYASDITYDELIGVLKKILE